MPLYEFTCTNCGETFEELVGTGETGAGLTCPECGAADVERIFSTFSSSGPAESAPRGGGSCGPRGFT